MSDQAPPRESTKQRLARLLSSPRLPHGALLASLLLLLPSLGHGLRMDDRWLRLLSQGEPGFEGPSRPAHRLFAFYESDAGNAWFREHGISPWFADLEMRLSFFRPLASLLHWAEHTFLSQHVWAMHAISLGCYAALVLAVLALLRQLLAPGREGRGMAEAGLATAMFALDNNHGIVVGWLAQRNSLLAAMFGALSVLFHDRAVRGERRLFAASAAMVLLALLSAEAGTATLLVLFAHALTLTRPGERIRSLVPYAPPVLLWAGLYVAGGYGVRHTGMYLDLLHHPARAIPTALTHLPVLLSLDLGNPLAEFWPLAPAGLRALTVVVALILIAGATAAAYRLALADAVTRFLMLASLLTLVPPSATLPTGRLVLFAGIFQLALVARLALRLLDGALEAPRFTGGLARGVVYYVAAGRLCLSPLMLTEGSRQMVTFENAFGTFAATVPEGAGKQQTVLVLNAPELGLFGYIGLIAKALGKTPPHRLLPLANGTREVTIKGVDERSFLLGSEGGFVQSGTDSLVRSLDRPLSLGARVEVAEVAIEIVHVDAQGQPDQARVTVPTRLDDPRFVWLTWKGRGFEPFALPAAGEERRMAGQSFLDHMLMTMRERPIEVPGR